MTLPGPVVLDTFPVDKYRSTSELSSVRHCTFVRTGSRPHQSDSRINTFARRPVIRVDFDSADDEMKHQRRRTPCFLKGLRVRQHCVHTSCTPPRGVGLRHLWRKCTTCIFRRPFRIRTTTSVSSNNCVLRHSLLRLPVHHLSRSKAVGEKFERQLASCKIFHADKSVVASTVPRHAY